MFWFDTAWQIQNVFNSWWMFFNIIALTVLGITAWLGYRKPVLATSIIAGCMPLYLLRATLGPLPTTFLELLIWAGFLGWFVGVMRRKHYIGGLKYFRAPIILLILAATLGLLIAPDTRAAAGLWKAYIVDPLLFFVMARSVIASHGAARYTLALSMALSGAIISIFAIAQYFTAFGIALPAWVAPDTRRVTAHYTSPNAIGLYLAPITILLCGWVFRKQTLLKRLGLLLMVALNLAAIYCTFSQGTWLGVGAGMLVILSLGVHWFIGPGLIALGTTIVLLSERLTTALTPYFFFKDPGGQSRLQLWSMAWDKLTSSIGTFVAGAGILGFAQFQNTTRDPQRIEALLYPHTFVFNFWLEFGLLGLLAVLFLISRTIRVARLDSRANPEHKAIILGALAGLIATIIHGFVDVPYFKNDLAVLWWLLIALV